MNEIFLIVNTEINNNTMLLLHERNIKFSIEIKQNYMTDYSNYYKIKLLLLLIIIISKIQIT